MAEFTFRAHGIGVTGVFGPLILAGGVLLLMPLRASADFGGEIAFGVPAPSAPVVERSFGTDAGRAQTPPAAEAAAPISVPPVSESEMPRPIVASPPPMPPPPDPTPEPPSPAAVTPEQPHVEASRPTEVEGNDELLAAGYVPGYRMHQSLSLSPYAPRVGGLPGGLTPGFAAPMPPGAWTFRFSGFLSATLQTSTDRKALTTDGAPRLVFHVPPQTLDEYASFLGTTTLPGQWVAMNFAYGNDHVTANISLNTWSPSQPATYYQIGSQYFINNAYLAFEVPLPSRLRLRLRTLAGYFYSFYGNLGQYSPGMYTNSIIGNPHGVGETSELQYSTGDVTVVLGHGIMGTRNGHAPDAVSRPGSTDIPGVVPTGGNGSANPIFAASWVNHLHLGFVRKGEPTVKAEIHYLVNWSQDDRVQNCQVPEDPSTCVDNPVTRGINEAHVPDGHIDVVGFDTAVQGRGWGTVSGGGVFIRGQNAFQLRGLTTFGGEGATLTDRWWGSASGGTGKLFAGGLNYSGSYRAMRGISGDGADVAINAGVIVAYTLVNTGPASGTTVPGPLPAAVDVFNHKRRTKFGADLMYTFASFMGAGVRIDRVAPNSKDADETFYVLASRLVFKTDWQSRGTLTLLYARWFTGPHSHPEASALVSSDIGLDDQVFALNVNMWW